MGIGVPEKLDQRLHCGRADLHEDLLGGRSPSDLIVREELDQRPDRRCTDLDEDLGGPGLGIIVRKTESTGKQPCAILDPVQVAQRRLCELLDAFDTEIHRCGSGPPVGRCNSITSARQNWG